LEIRLKEGAKMGFRKAIVPPGLKKNFYPSQMEVVSVESASQALDILLGIR